MQALDQAATPERAPSRGERNPQVLSVRSESTIETTLTDPPSTMLTDIMNQDIGHYDSGHWTRIVISHLYLILFISLQSLYNTHSCSV
jgi:hypothetical protein